RPWRSSTRAGSVGGRRSCIGSKGRFCCSPQQVPGQSQTSQDTSEEASTQHPTPRMQAEAETCFCQALDIARRQQAKSWELRAGMTLVVLWQRQGKRAEAHELLAPVYGWFTEGFDTADLQDAKVLLEELEG